MITSYFGVVLFGAYLIYIVSSSQIYSAGPFFADDFNDPRSSIKYTPSRITDLLFAKKKTDVTTMNDVSPSKDKSVIDTKYFNFQNEKIYSNIKPTNTTQKPTGVSIVVPFTHVDSFSRIHKEFGCSTEVPIHDRSKSSSNLYQPSLQWALPLSSNSEYFNPPQFVAPEELLPLLTPSDLSTTKQSNVFYPGFPNFHIPPYVTTRPTKAIVVTTRKPFPTQDIDSTEKNRLPEKCGKKNSISKDQERIVGGVNASPNEFPWMAALFKSGKQFCGGSLITKSHILTAAHCVSRMSAWDVAALTAHLGDYNIRTNFEVQHVSRRIKRLVRHKGFDFSHLHNDIAILTLSEDVKFSFEIQPICLPTAKEYPFKSYSGKIGIVTGWGSLRENGPQPSILQKVNIVIWSNHDCSQKYGPSAPGGIIESMLCAGQLGKDSCSGDSGGPMIIKEAGHYVQVGIVSWGIGCGKGQFPGVYTRISSLLPWIYKNIK